ncbi:hypothetical protein FBY21_0359 [Pseudomonas sp. SLBN-26]|uniref:hypothetical protein n=1 Tax=Pseudomonadaceae TaxID=135621 RepID=UPI00116F2FEB|nr:MULTISPECIES: hypothetical protein [Pseudomonas]MCP1615751.1 Sec-independent protein translocase protein TatA [Pseudomonas otitidis]TQL05021.1 hypothetical protein FBY21_0359 [Pseudomonas sp. SLBN-26]
MRIDISGWPFSSQHATTLRSAKAEGGQDPAQTEEAKAAGSATAAEQSGVKVSLSKEGVARSEGTGKNDDIDESGLPDVIKQILKMIRRLREQVQEKQKELQEVATDSSLDEETRKLRQQQLRGELASLNSALTTALVNLRKAMKESKLSDEQSVKAMSLAMK